MKSHPKSDEFLEFLAFALDKLPRPSLPRLLESFESWEYRTRLRPQLRRLARSGMIEMNGRAAQRTLVISDRGRVAVSLDVDPNQRWRRAWDGKWRVLLFDLPTNRPDLRMRLWRWMRAHRFGYLQQSVWLSADPIDETHLPLKSLKLTPESFAVIEGRPVPPDRDVDLVRGAWDFNEIDRRYGVVLQLAAVGRELLHAAQAKIPQRRKWLATQRAAWADAVTLDPLLPAVLWPEGYLGRKALETRREVLAKVVGD
ncbi:MAG: hypothetical protein DME26_17785 [Verrucomicrobia bacterium]|nr:MAG: hypothetical protein DME26_17785 [Verrucomicrobiota bacterium]